MVALQAQSVRLPLESGTQRLRGFGYAEFDNINDLKEALLLKGEVRPYKVFIGMPAPAHSSVSSSVAHF